ncbi:MAG: ribosome maturation factor RimP [Cyclobacteriaceae bacterium]|nr:ribosome maturation factor RimP [Cyclobacteriaceae bacterium]MCH8517660.1 ribosome maturation factor RimP [Cyclobacteriaceae bacterium]
MSANTLELIKAALVDCFPEEDIYLVDIQLGGNASGKQSLKILIDADSGLKIDDCATISRCLGAKIEEDEMIPGAYVLEVSSPGVDFPLNDVRQYRKNEGRRIKAVMQDGKEIEGELLVVNDETILMMAETKEKGKKKVKKEEKEIAFSEINYSKVLISFK